MHGVSAQSEEERGLSVWENRFLLAIKKKVELWIYGFVMINHRKNLIDFGYQLKYSIRKKGRTLYCASKRIRKLPFDQESCI